MRIGMTLGHRLEAATATPNPIGLHTRPVTIDPVGIH